MIKFFLVFYMHATTECFWSASFNCSLYFSSLLITFYFSYSVFSYYYWYLLCLMVNEADSHRSKFRIVCTLLFTTEFNLLDFFSRFYRYLLTNVRPLVGTTFHVSPHFPKISAQFKCNFRILKKKSKRDAECIQ